MLYLEANTSVQGDSMTQVIETAPEMHLTPRDIENLLGEVKAYYAIYEPLLGLRRFVGKNWTGGQLELE
jgi:hypothetical protein